MSDAMKNEKDTSKEVSETAAEKAAPKPEPAPAPKTISSSPAPQAPKKKTGLIVGVVVAVVVVVIAIVCAVAFAGGGGFYDNSAQNGQAPYKTDEEMQAELNRVVEDGMLNISIASVIEFQNGTSEGTAYIENVPSNKYVMKVSIALDSNGDIVYESGGLKPDTHIDTIKLNQDLPAGTYPAKATFTAYNPDNLEEVGQAAAKITIIVDE